MALADIWRLIAVHGLAGGAGVALWFGTQPPRGGPTGDEQAALATSRERSVEVQLRGRDLADVAVEAHGEKPVLAPWAPRSSRQLAEEALAKRDERIAARQADAVALVAAAGKFSKDKRLLEKIEESLFTGGDDEQAEAMMLALVQQDEERALAELGSREALLDAFTGLDVFEGLQTATLEAWVARGELPMRLRKAAADELAGRMGPASDLEGVAGVWEQVQDPGMQEDVIRSFVSQWLCDDGPEAVGIIFDEWPEELRLHFLEELDGSRDLVARPIWTETLAAAMRDAPWASVPEELATGILNEIKRSEEPSIITNVTLTPPRLSSGMEGGVARWQISSRVRQLLDHGPDLREQLADGRIDVDGLSRRVASRLPGSELYPAEFAEVIFEECAGIDPVGALSYSRGKIAREEMVTLGSEVLRKIESDEWCLDRVLATAALLPSGKGESGGSGSADWAEDFVAWNSLAPELATEALSALSAEHPARKTIEEAFKKEGAR